MLSSLRPGDIHLRHSTSGELVQLTKPPQRKKHLSSFKDMSVVHTLSPEHTSHQSVKGLECLTATAENKGTYLHWRLSVNRRSSEIQGTALGKSLRAWV